MAAQKGRDLLIRLADGTGGFATVAGLRTRQLALNAETVEVKVPFDDIGIVTAGGFDGVTAGLRVNASVHAPLLCVVNVFKVASGDLSLPG